MTQSAPGANHGRELSVGCASGISYEALGDGETLLLIHGTGGSRFHWQPVIGSLSAHRRLLLVDLPGHGRSALAPPGVSRTPVGYAEILDLALGDLGLDTVHICGHSAGAWAALELAKRGRAKSVVAIAPAGLWPDREPWSHSLALAAQYAIGRAFGPVVPQLMRRPWVRSALMRRTFAKPRELSGDAAAELARTLAATPGMPPHIRETRRTRFRGGRDLTIPVTVAWGEEEQSIPPAARRREELPVDTRFVTLADCGHMAVWDDPGLVADVIRLGISPKDNDDDASTGVEEAMRR